MAVTLVQEQESRSSTHNIKNERTYTRQWLVETNSATDDAVTVENAWVTATGIARGTAHPSDANAIAKEISTSCDSEDGKSWTVTCSYGGWDETELSPLDQPADIQYSFSQYEKIVDQDIFDDPVVNGVKEPFKDPITIDDSRLILQVTKNEATFPVATAQAYVNSVNSDTWRGGTARQWRCSNISAQRKFDEEYGVYYTVSYEFQFKVEKWDTVILHQGLKQHKRNSAGTAFETDDDGELIPVKIYDSGTEISEPVLLQTVTLAGTEGAIRKPQSDPPEWLTFRLYPELPFSGVFNF